MSNNLAAFTPIKYSLKLVELLYNDVLYRDITNSDYEGTIREEGDRVRVRTSAKITLSNYTKGMTLVRQDLAPIFEDLIVDQAKYFSFAVDDVDKLQNDVDTINTYSGNSKNDMAEVLDIDILSYMRKNVLGDSMIGTAYTTGTVSIAAGTGVVTGTGTTFTASMVGGLLKATGHTTYYLVSAYTSATSITIVDQGDNTVYTGGIISGATYTINGAVALALTSSNVYQYIIALRTALGKALAAKKDRFIVVNAQFEGLLLQAPQFIPAVQGAYDNAVLRGLLGTIGGFKVLSSELVDGNNTTGYWFVAGTKTFCAMALQIMKTSVVPSEADPNSFVSTCKGLLVWGRKVYAGTRSRGACLRATLA